MLLGIRDQSIVLCEITPVRPCRIKSVPSDCRSCGYSPFAKYQFVSEGRHRNATVQVATSPYSRRGDSERRVLVWSVILYDNDAASWRGSAELDSDRVCAPARNVFREIIC